MAKPVMKRNRELKWLPVDSIIANERNPRREQHFTADQLARLRASISDHGVLEPVIVEPYNEGEGYLLIEGERRWRSAKLQGAKEMPAVVVGKMDEHDQIVTMFNIHTNRRGWEMAEELTAIKELKERNGHMSDEEMAKELGMSKQSLRERLDVLGMGAPVITKIAKGDLDYSEALRATQISKSLERKRPDVTESLGGREAVERKLIRKATSRKGPGGISAELVDARRDLTDPAGLSEKAVKEYIEKPATTIKEVRTTALQEAHKIEDLSRDVHRIERRIRSFDANLAEAPNLRQLRAALASLISAAQQLENEVSEALRKRRPEAEQAGAHGKP